MLIFLFLSFPMLIFAIPQSCSKLFVSRSYDYYSIGNLTVSANLKLIKNLNNSTTIFVDNVTVDGNVNLGYPTSICANVESGNGNFPTPEFCSSSLKSPLNFTTQKPAFNLEIHFSNSYFFLYFGFADDGTFSAKDGTLFSSKNLTIIEIDNQELYQNIYNQTCTELIPAPIPPKFFPKCKNFQSQTLILNSTDSFGIYASSYMSWFLRDKKMEASGNFTISGNYFFDYILNDDDELCTGFGCSFNLKSGDQKLIISASIDKRIGFNLLQTPIPMIGRIIFRENQTLMKDGTLFSPKNDCLFFNFPFSDDLVSSSKFCCTEFEDSV